METYEPNIGINFMINVDGDTWRKKNVVQCQQVTKVHGKVEDLNMSYEL